MIALPFQCPTSLSVSGTTGAGKTTWVFNLLRNKNTMLHPPPLRVLYCYGIWQELFEEIEREMDFITFHEGLPEREAIDNLASGSMIVLDDLSHLLCNNVEMELLFSQISHHKNLSVCQIKNNIFYQGKNAKTISLNTHIYVLMQNPRDVSQIVRLGSQIYPGKGKALLEAYEESMLTTGYLVLDISPHSDVRYRIRTNIFPGKDIIAFIPK
jgi:hypothetical protein